MIHEAEVPGSARSRETHDVEDVVQGPEQEEGRSERERGRRDHVVVGGGVVPRWSESRWWVRRAHAVMHALLFLDVGRVDAVRKGGK